MSKESPGWPSVRVLGQDFQLFTCIQRGDWCGLHCAHRATTVLSWGLSEQEGWLPAPLNSLCGLETQFRLHSFTDKKFQKRLIGDISLVGQRLELIQKRFRQPE